jgi:tRNA pseudouridine55 synthase
VFDKPSGLTSRDVVDRVQRCFPRRTRIGHAGTLDPLATGVLVLCVGVATRFIEYVQRMDKTYRARLLLGARSDTDDAEGAVCYSNWTGRPPGQAEVARCLQEFIGPIQQVPPAYSAIKKGGLRSYERARRGETVALEARTVQIYHLDLLAYQYPHLEIQVHCGKGTYIRALARDLGERLGCGALVEGLRRTQLGPFQASRALGLETDPAQVRAWLLPLAAAVAGLAQVQLDAASITRLRRGQSVAFSAPPSSNSAEEKPAEVAVFDAGRNLVAVAVLQSERLFPVKVVPEL